MEGRAEGAPCVPSASACDFGCGPQPMAASHPLRGYEPAPKQSAGAGAPPRCTSCNTAEQKVLHECLLHVHAIFRLVPDDGLGAVDDVGFHFLAPVRGQAVHEQGVGLGGGHHLLVHAPVGEREAARFVLGFVAHAGPHIGGDDVGTLAGFERIAEKLIAASACPACPNGQFFIYFVTLGRAHMHLEAQQRGGLQPGVGHVVAVADPGHRLALDGASVLDEGEDVGQDLAGVEFVGQAVDDGHTRMLRKTLDLGLLEGADHHQVHHAADDLGAVFNRLGVAELAVARGQVHHAAAKLVHARLKAHARARAGLLENHGQRAVNQRVVLLVGLEFLLDQRGALEQVGVFVGGEVVELQIVFHGCLAWRNHSARKALTRGVSSATMASASTVVRISGGTMRTTLSAVTLMSSPASAARCTSTPQGLASSTPIIRPWPRTSFTPSRPPSSRRSAACRCAPTVAAFCSRPSSSMMRMVSTPARMASGLPPKVVPWLPGCSTLAALGPATTAPTGTPEPRPLASGITSGRMPAHWCANPLPVRPMPHCTSSIIISQSRSLHSWRSCCRYSTRMGFTPPSPWMVSKNTATTFGLPSVALRMASMSFIGTRMKPSTRGPKPACTLGLPVAESVAMERPWKAFSYTTTSGLSMPLSWPYLRAIFSAASLASRPELQKNTFCMPDSSTSLAASCSCRGMW